MRQETLLAEALSRPASAIPYFLTQQLTTLYPGKALLQCDRPYAFDVEAYARAGHCAAALHPQLVHQIATRWEGVEQGLVSEAENAWFEITWQGHPLEVLKLTWCEGGCTEERAWVLADTGEVAENFLAAVSEWCSEVRGEVLVFESGCWEKSEPLFRAIKNATFDNLILPAGLKEEIQADFSRFFASRPIYERYRVPWKRGVLFIGPPGNGKTHTVKALINGLGQPCLYVKSLKSRCDTEHANIRRVFERARKTTPCILVLEDLDSLLTDANRSFFLNELDGFAANTGIVVLATTNHPERLDPAILERPSRFDRKYHFELPCVAERNAYLRAWNETLEPALRLSQPTLTQIACQTEGFSFAYLKELFLSAMMRWIADRLPGGMDAILPAQIGFLREQMRRAAEEPLPEASEKDEDDED
ncbi:MAG TPA: ATP-binding protein [Chthonomonadaceae bacterium]|nr:ATP-binding protein [Chthonomonadaceae bacterium]